MDPFQAVQSNNMQRIKKVINSKGLDFNAVDDQGKSFLDYAVDNYNLEAALLLLNAGATKIQNIMLLKQLLQRNPAKNLLEAIAGIAIHEVHSPRRQNASGSSRRRRNRIKNSAGFEVVRMSI